MFKREKKVYLELTDKAEQADRPGPGRRPGK